MTGEFDDKNLLLEELGILYCKVILALSYTRDCIPGYNLVSLVMRQCVKNEDANEGCSIHSLAKLAKDWP